MLLLALNGVAALELGRRHRRLPRKCAAGVAGHPLAAWLMENFAVVATAVSMCAVVPLPRRRSPLSALATFLAGNMVLNWGLVLWHFAFMRVFRELPYFTHNRRPPTRLSVMFKEWITSNVVADVFSSSVVAAKILELSDSQFSNKFYDRRFSPVHFLAKLGVVRVVVDIGFYVGHRLLHHPRLYWLHRRHHEHRSPSMATNFHFSAVDFFVEAASPAGFGLAVLELAGVGLSRLEGALMIAYVGWHEQGSHCGKPMPTVSYFPPLAPLYRLVFGWVDDGNIRHHDLHHQCWDGNYGISIWPDKVMGTLRQPPEGATGK